MIGFHPLKVLGSSELTVSVQLRCRLPMGFHNGAKVSLSVVALACLFVCLAAESFSYAEIQQSALSDVCRKTLNNRVVGFHSGRRICPLLSSKPITLRTSGKEAFFGQSQCCPLPLKSTSATSITDNFSRISRARRVSCAVDSRKGPMALTGKQHEFLELSNLPLSTVISQSEEPMMNKYSELTELPSVQVHPPVLDWGERNLYSCSMKSITVLNSCNKSVLTVYEPYSSNSLFSPTNYSVLALKPGQAASLSFAFMPRSPGSFSGKLMLQTSSGGFLIKVRGSVVDSPWKMTPRLMFPPNTRSSTCLLNHNPERDMDHVTQVFSYETESSHNLRKLWKLDGKSQVNGVPEWMNFRPSEDTNLLVLVRSYDKRDVASFRYKIMSYLVYDWKGRVLMLDLNESSSDGNMIRLIHCLFDTALLRDDSNTAAVLSTKCVCPHTVQVQIMHEVTKNVIFQSRYNDDFLLVHGLSDVTSIECSSILGLQDSTFDVYVTSKCCKLVVLTNDFCCPLMELPCKHRLKNDSGHQWNLCAWCQPLGKDNCGANITSKVCGADEFICRSWKNMGANKRCVIDVDEMHFPLNERGIQLFWFIIPNNPSDLRVVTQVVLENCEIADVGRVQTCQTGWWGSCDPILDSSQCRWRCYDLIGKKPTGMEQLGLVTSFDLVRFGISERIKSADLYANFDTVKHASPDMGFHRDGTVFGSILTLKEFLGEMVGYISQGYHKISVVQCEPGCICNGEENKFLLSYQIDLCGAAFHRDLDLALNNGIVVEPLRTTLSLSMLDLCWKSVIRQRFRKLSATFLLAAFIILIISFLFLSEMMRLAYHEYQPKSHHKSAKNGVRNPVKISEKHSDRSSKISASDSSSTAIGIDKTIEGHQYLKTPKLTSQPTGIASSLSESPPTDIPEIQSLWQPSKLTVRIGQDKVRRRKKKRGPKSVLSTVDISSSQSGNSTPTSPLSPATSSTPGSSWSRSPDMDHSLGKSPFSLSAQPKDCSQESRTSEHQPKAEGHSSANCCNMETGTYAKPGLLPVPVLHFVSRNTSSAACRPAVPTSTLPPHARAPGWELRKRKAAVLEVQGEDKYRYDIWGDFFSGLLDLRGSPKDFAVLKTVAPQSDFAGYFVRSPHSMLTQRSWNAFNQHES